MYLDCKIKAVFTSLLEHKNLYILIVDGPIGGCQVASNGKSFNMGYIQSKPIAHTDGTLTMHYRNGDTCHKGTENEAHRSTRINFFCSDVEVMILKINLVVSGHVQLSMVDRQPSITYI